MVDRIKQIMEFYKLAPASFAEQIGINRSNLTHLFSGRNQPSLELAKKILNCYPEIKTEWLIMGVGEMLRSDDDRELQIQIQKEKQMQIAHAEPDLFSLPTIETISTVELPVVEKKENSEQIFDSREMPKITPSLTRQPTEKEVAPSHPTATVSKIIFFYSDNSFEIFHPTIILPKN